MMWFYRFWTQESKAYRNMQIALPFLTLNFLIPSMSYFFFPEVAIAQFKQIGQMLGASHYPLSEQSHIWRVLAASNVFTLGMMCLFLQLNIQRFYAIIPVFTILKGYSALGFLYVFIFQLHYPVFLAVFFYDSLAVFLVLFFGMRAYANLKSVDLEKLVPSLKLN